MAHKIIGVINSFISELTPDTPATDEQFRAGCTKLCEKIVERRGSSHVTVASLMDKIVRNAYTSIYENEMKFLRM